MRFSICGIRKLLIAASIVALATAEGAAQSNTFEAPYGISPNGAYSSYNIDSVNMVNGNLIINIPLYSLPQLGKLALSFSAVANSVGWQQQETCQDDLDECQYFYINPQPGYIAPINGYGYGNRPLFAVGPIIANDHFSSIAGPYQTSSTDQYGDTWFHNDWALVDQTGASHMLIYDASNSSQLRTTDGSGYLFESGIPDPYYDSSGSYTVVGPNGVKTNWNSSTSMITQTDPSILPSGTYSNTITLQNGNYTDTLGRPIPAPPTTYSTSVTQGCPAPQGDNQPTVGEASWIVPGPNGGQIKYLLCYADVNIHTDFWGNQGQAYDYQGLGPDGYTVWDYEDDESVGTVAAIQSVVLPDGSYYEFTYQSADTNAPMSDSYPYIAYGGITGIHLPQGGNVQYAYGETLACQDNGAVGLPALTSRTVTDINGHSNTWTYSYGKDSGTINLMTDPSGNDTAYTLLHSPNNPNCAGYVQTKTTYQGSMASGVKLKSTQTSYSFTATPLDTAGAAYGDANALVTSATTTLNNSASATMATGYDSGVFTGDNPDCGFGYGMNLTDPCSTESALQTVALSMSFPTSSIVTDYSGATLKKTTTSYTWQTSGSPYWTANILDTPQYVTVYDGNNNEVAQTTNTYDVNSSCAADLGYLTQTSRWVNSTSSIETTQTWNCKNGKVSQEQDGNGNITSLSYENGDTGPFPSTVTHPATHGVQHVDSYTWDDVTGSMGSHKDWNNNTTHYTYDSVGRLIKVTNPDQSTTTYSYPFYTGTSSCSTDFPCLREVDVASDLNASQDGLLKSKIVFDGLDHAIMSEAANGAYTESAYNYFDKVCAVSNPDYTDPGTLSCNASNNPTLSGTGGISYYAYDPLGRMTRLTRQDGSARNWSYSGNSVAFSDENGSEWTRTSDTLGRLTKVLEPNGSSQSPSMETDYAYDPLGDLVSVTQWGGPSGSSGGRTRSFTYDGLSELLSATNPETGTDYYTYDADGNVISRTDARNIITNYTYDDLNRLVSKTYSGNVQTGQLSSCFEYDQPSTGNNLVGRLVAEWTQAGACPASPPSGPQSVSLPNGYQSLRLIGAYDLMGRIISEQQCVLGFCTSQAPPSAPPANCSVLPAANGLSYCYDLAGNLTAYSNGLNSTAYPQQSILFSQSFNGAGRLTSVGSSMTGAQLPGCLFNAQSGSDTPSQWCTQLLSQPVYTPFGALQNWTLGGGNISVTKTYDNRTRVLGETVNQQ